MSSNKGLIVGEIGNDCFVVIFCLNPEWFFDKVFELKDRNNLDQFRKYYDDKDVNYLVVFNKLTNKTLAAAAIKKTGKYVFVYELQSFKKGYGKCLLWWIIDIYQKVKLCANYMDYDVDKLLSYYRDSDFGFKEYVKDFEGNKIHYFYT